MVTKKIKNKSKPKKTTSKKIAKKNSKSKGKSSKNSELSPDDIGIVVIDDDIKMDKEAELEARRLYLEEARSQEASD